MCSSFARPTSWESVLNTGPPRLTLPEHRDASTSISAVQAVAHTGSHAQSCGQSALGHHGSNKAAESIDLTLREKNRKAQQKSREKLKVDFARSMA